MTTFSDKLWYVKFSKWQAKKLLSRFELIFFKRVLHSRRFLGFHFLLQTLFALCSPHQSAPLLHPRLRQCPLEEEAKLSNIKAKPKDEPQIVSTNRYVLLNDQKKTPIHLRPIVVPQNFGLMGVSFLIALNHNFHWLHFMGQFIFKIEI